MHDIMRGNHHAVKLLSGKDKKTRTVLGFMLHFPDPAVKKTMSITGYAPGQAAFPLWKKNGIDLRQLTYYKLQYGGGAMITLRLDPKLEQSVNKTARTDQEKYCRIYCQIETTQPLGNRT